MTVVTAKLLLAIQAPIFFSTREKMDHRPPIPFSYLPASIEQTWIFSLSLCS